LAGKALLPNDTSDAGRATEDSDVPANALASIVVKELPKITDVRLDTFSKAPAPTRTSESGNANDRIDVPRNARAPMLFTELPNATAARLDAPSAA
jgi:hypothetical protein